MSACGAPTMAGPTSKGPSNNPAYTNPIYSYPHNGRDACDYRRFCLSRHSVSEQLPRKLLLCRLRAELDQASDVRRQWQCQRRLQFRARQRSGRRTLRRHRVFDRGPRGRPLLCRLGFSDTTGAVGVSKIRRISYVDSNLPPVVSASATPTGGPPPLTVNFSSAGSSDPEGSAAHLFMEFRRRNSNFDRGQPDAHLY